jgi:hypothetical protein
MRSMLGNQTKRSFSDRWAASLALAQESLAVLKRTPSLAWFPVISALATVAVSMSFAVPTYLLTGFHNVEKTNPMVAYPLMFAYYFVTYFVVIFFNAGLVSCAHDSLMGRPTSFGQGMANAAKLLPAILGWTLIASTVGVILKYVGERTGLIGTIITGIIGMAWNLVTYFVVPVLVVEKGSPVAAVKESTSLLKRTWGENLIGNTGIALVFGLAALGGVALILAACITQSVYVILPAVGIAAIYWLLLAIVSASLSGVYQTALFVYAKTGTIPNGFSEDLIRGAFQPRPGVLDRFRK